MTQNTMTQKPFGIFRCTALVVGNMVGTSIFLLPAILAGSGSISLVGWLLTALGSLCLAYVFSRLGHRMPWTGGPYAYCHAAFGDFVGVQIAWSYWIANCIGNAAVAIAFVNLASYFYPTLNTVPMQGLGAGLFLIWSLTALNCISLKNVGAFQVIVTVLKLVPLLTITIWGLPFVEMKNFTPFIADGVDPFAAIGAAAALTLFSFTGLESATIPAANVQDPEKTIPRATLWGTSISAMVYIVSTLVLFGLLSPTQIAGHASPFSLAGEMLFGTWAGPVIAASIAFSCFGTLNGWILVQGQVPMAAAQDKLFPSIFGHTSKQGIPVFALVISSVLMSFILMANYQMALVKQFEFIVKLTTFSIMLPYFYSAAAELLFIFAEKPRLNPRHLIRPVFVTVMALIYSVWIIISLGQELVFYGTLFILTSVPLFIWVKTRSRTSPLVREVASKQSLS